MKRRDPIALDHAWFTDASERRLWLAVRTICGACSVLPMVALFWSGLS